MVGKPTIVDSIHVMKKGGEFSSALIKEEIKKGRVL